MRARAGRPPHRSAAAPGGSPAPRQPRAAAPSERAQAPAEDADRRVGMPPSCCTLYVPYMYLD